MTETPETWMFLIREPDWDSDAFTPEAVAASETRQQQLSEEMVAHERFARAVAELGATIVASDALCNRQHGGTVTPAQSQSEPVWSDAPLTDSTEVITGFYQVACDEATARRLAPQVPSRGVVEMRLVHRFG